jgi:integrase
VPIIRLHDARHTAATIMLDSGNTVSANAKRLGHDPAMTLHVYEESLKSAGATLFDTDEATG